MKFIITALIVTFTTSAFAAIAKPVCGGTSSSKYIQLLAPANPPRECVYNFDAYSSNVCQIRIDFAMTLAQPRVPNQQNGLSSVQCADDYFLVNDKIRLCGVETHQHVYLPFNRTGGIKTVSVKIVLAARTGTTNLPTPHWDMLVTQLECPSGSSVRSQSVENMESNVRAIKDGYYVAPIGCLQYYPDNSGRFTSFNFNNGKGLYPGNLNYAICFRRTDRTKFMEIVPYFFHLGAEYAEKPTFQLDNHCISNLNSDMSEDYIMVPEATFLNSKLKATYFCGQSLDEDILRSTNPGPLMIVFNSDGRYKQKEAGFDLYFRVM